MGQAPQVLVVGPVAWHTVNGSQPPLLTSQGLGPPDEELDAPADEELDAPADVAPLDGAPELGLPTEAELPGAALEAPVNDEEGAGALLESSALELSPPEDADADAEAPMVAADEGSDAEEADAAALEDGTLEVAAEEVPEREVPPLLVAADDAREVPALEPEAARELLATSPELLAIPPELLATTPELLEEDASSPELLPAHPTPDTTHNNGTATRNKVWFMVERSGQAQRLLMLRRSLVQCGERCVQHQSAVTQRQVMSYPRGVPGCRRARRRQGSEKRPKNSSAWRDASSSLVTRPRPGTYAAPGQVWPPSSMVHRVASAPPLHGSNVSHTASP